MKKFYFSAFLTILLLFSIAAANAQGTYVTYGGGGLWSGGFSTWITGPPPNPCSDCTIIIQGPVTWDAASGDPFTFSTAGLGGNKIILTAGSTLSVDVFVVGVALTITISDPATLNVNNEMQLFGGQVTLNGYGSFLNSTNAPNISSTGTLFPGDPAGAGIYYNRGIPPPFPLDPLVSHYDAIISAQGAYGSNAGVIYSFLDPYLINCNGNPPAAGNPCASGLVYGPARMVDSLAITPAPNDVFRFYNDISVLPVTLLKFTATPGNRKSVNINWTTVLEINSDYFEIERSADATNFQSIGKVSAKGNSSGIEDYTFVDPAPINAVNYYRLKMVDRDAKFEYSKVAKVVMSETANALVVYNNPFHDQVSIKVNLSAGQMLDLKLTDISGRVMNQQTVQGQPGDNFINIPAVSTSNGLYILTIQGPSYSQSVKLIRQ